MDKLETRQIRDDSNIDMRESVGLEGMHARNEWLRKQSEPLDSEAIEALCDQLEVGIARVVKLCNLLILRPKGLPESANISIRHVKESLLDLRYFLDHRNPHNLPVEIMELTGELVALHKDDDSDVGVTARRLLAILGDASA